MGARLSKTQYQCLVVMICLAMGVAQPLKAITNKSAYEFEEQQESTALAAIGIMLVGLGIYTAITQNAPDAIDDDLGKFKGTERANVISGYVDPCIIEYERPTKKAYGVVVNVTDTQLLLDIGGNKKIIAMENIRKIKNLEIEAKRQSARRLGGGILGLFGAAGVAIIASTEQSALRKFDVPMIAAFLAASAISFAIPSRTERENDKWQSRLHPSPSLGLVLNDMNKENRGVGNREIASWNVCLSLNWRF